MSFPTFQCPGSLPLGHAKGFCFSLGSEARATQEHADRLVVQRGKTANQIQCCWLGAEKTLAIRLTETDRRSIRKLIRESRRITELVTIGGFAPFSMIHWGLDNDGDVDNLGHSIRRARQRP